MRKLVLGLSVLAMVSCVNSQKNVQASEKKVVKVALNSKSGSNVGGEAVFEEQNGVVTMRLDVSGLDEGIHAVHLHEKADCSSADGTSAGGHWNPTNTKHGKWGSADGYHKGDIGNIVAGKDGKAKLVFKTEEWCIGCGDATKDILQKSVIIHKGSDDFVTQPTGNAGGRVSCAGVIKE